MKGCLQRQERGATAVEYGLLLAGIAAVLIGVIGTLGMQVFGFFNLTSSWPW